MDTSSVNGSHTLLCQLSENTPHSLFLMLLLFSYVKTDFLFT